MKLDGIFFNYFFYSHFKEKRNEKILKKANSHKFFVYYNQDKENELTQLSSKYGTNKGGSKQIMVGGKILAPHSYTDFYSHLFMFGKDRAFNLFECGIGTNNSSLKSTMGQEGQPGASLYMWREYFPNANIYGGDIDRKILFNDERIKTFYLDQTSSNSVENFFAETGNQKFEVMIDDGLHEFNAGKTLFMTAQKYLTESGIYIIEDVSQNDISKYADWITSLGLNAKFISLYRPNLRINDNNLIMIEPKRNNEQS